MTIRLRPYGNTISQNRKGFNFHWCQLYPRHCMACKASLRILVWLLTLKCQMWVPKQSGWHITWCCHGWGAWSTRTINFGKCSTRDFAKSYGWIVWRQDCDHVWKLQESAGRTWLARKRVLSMAWLFELGAWHKRSAARYHLRSKWNHKI